MNEDSRFNRNTNEEELLISDITKLIWFGWKSPSSPLALLPREIIRQITLNLYEQYDNVFGSEDNDGNIVYKYENFERKVRSATLVKLVEKTTESRHLIDPLTLVLTHKTFTTSTNLFDLFVARFWMLPPSKLTQPEFLKWKKEVLLPYRLRVLNFFKLWMERTPEDFVLELRAKMLKFIHKDLHVTGHNTTAARLKKILEMERKVELNIELPPKPILPNEKNDNNYSLLDFNAEELARQITIVDFAIFKKIRPAELLGSNWCKQDKLLRSPNVCALIERFQFLSGWAATEIVNTRDLTERVQKIIKLLEVAEKCGQLNNVHGLVAITSSIDTSAVYRLKRTWSELPQTAQEYRDTLRRTISRERNFLLLRRKHAEATPPLVPYLGLYLTDLIFMEEGGANYSEFNQLIYWEKRQRIAEVLNQVLAFQKKGYNLQEVQVIQNYLQSYEPLREAQLLELSLQLEPI